MSRALCQLAIEIWTWCTERNITLQAEHLPGQLNSRPMRSPGQQRIAALEAESISVPADRSGNGSTRSGFVCITPDKTASPLLQLKTRSRSKGDKYIHVELGFQLRIFQFAVVPDILLPHQSEERSSESSTNNTSVENPAMVPTSTGTPGGLSLEDFPTIRLDINDSGAAISDVTGSTPVDRLAYLRYPTHHEEFMLTSWRDKTNSNYGSLFSKWASWCK